MRIAHISDSHISVDHPQRNSDLQACIDAITSDVKPVDVVVHTGDISHHGLAEEYSIAEQSMAPLGVPLFVLAGNRDKRRELATVFADNRFIHLDDEFIQYSVEHLDTRMIMLDTVSIDSNKGRICPARFEHIEAMLAADQSRPVAIFMHHTPFSVDAIPDPQQFENWADVERLQTLFSHYQQVTGIFCGHIHRSIDGQLGGLSVSAISCIASDLRKGEMSTEQKTSPMVSFHEI